MEKLTFKELHDIMGGISQEEYCAQLTQIISDNWDNWDDHTRHSAAYAYEKYC